MNDNEKDANYWRDKYKPKLHTQQYYKSKYENAKITPWQSASGTIPVSCFPDSVLAGSVGIII